MPYSEAELEAIGLCVALEAVDDMANRALLDVPRDFQAGNELEIRYKDRQHQQLFVIRLLDFAKESGDQNLTGVRGSCLTVLRNACRRHSFGSAASAATLESATVALADWLNLRTTFRMWLPTLNVDAELTIPRGEFLYILGNHAKHNLSRLTRISQRIHHTLEEHGYSIDPEQVPLALDDFREHLQDNYFVYYGTWLAELVNNVRWGIQDYLTDIYQWAYVAGEHPAYSFRYPATINAAAPREWFWRLMNHVRAGPYLMRFVGSRSMKREDLIY